MVKVNYSEDKWGDNKGKEKVSSVTVRCIEKANSWRIKKSDEDVKEVNGYVMAPRKRAFQRFSTSWVTDAVPDFIKELLGDDE